MKRMERMDRLSGLASFCRATALVLALAPVFSHAAPPKKAGADSPPGDVYFKQITLDEAAQFISQIGKTSIVVTSSVANKVVSLYLRDVSVEGMVKNLCRAAGVWYRYDNQTRTYILMNAQEYQQDIAITRDEITRSYVLRHHNVVSIANAVEALFGNRVDLVEPVEEEEEQLGLSGASGSGSGRSGYSNSYSGSSRSSRRSITNSSGSFSRRSGGSGGSAGRQADVRKEIATVSQTGLEAALDVDSSLKTDFDAADVLAATSRQGPPISVTYNRLHNLLLVRTSDEAALKDIDGLVKEMDRPPRQVLLEMRIIEVELGNDFRSVFDIGTSSNRTTPTGPNGLGVASPINGGATDSEGNFGYPRNAASFGNFAAEASTAVWQLVNDRLRLRLQLLENENRVNVLATPTLVAANNQSARLFIGTEQILVTGASADSTTGTTGATNTTVTVETSRRDVGQTLVILPRINADRSVTLTIDQDNSRVIPGGATLPLAAGDTVYNFPIDMVNTASLQVTAHARDGLTVAVGGMIRQSVSDAEEKVPLLGDVPVLGNLFKRTVRGNTRSQLVLLITPYVLETPEESDALAREKENEARRLDASRGGKPNDWVGKPSTSIFAAPPAAAAPAPEPAMTFPVEPPDEAAAPPENAPPVDDGRPAARSAPPAPAAPSSDKSGGKSGNKSGGLDWWSLSQ